jgi:hypothetical protein
MNADKLTRITAVLAVIAVATVAAVISYRHATLVVSAHGEPGMVGHMYPVLIDGLIVAASMVLLDSARHREPASVLAWWMLAVGILATLAVNVLAGVPSGYLGAIVAAWPALAFVGCYELLMVLVRSAARRTVAGMPEPAQDGLLPGVPADVLNTAMIAMRATHAAGNPLSVRQLEVRFGLTRTQATKLRQHVLPQDAENTPNTESDTLAA